MSEILSEKEINELFFGKPVTLEDLDELSKKLEEKIKPYEEENNILRDKFITEYMEGYLDNIGLHEVRDILEDVFNDYLKVWDGTLECPACHYIQEASYMHGGLYHPRKSMECLKCRHLIGFNCDTGELLDD